MNTAASNKCDVRRPLSQAMPAQILSITLLVSNVSHRTSFVICRMATELPKTKAAVWEMRASWCNRANLKTPQQPAKANTMLGSL
jgi:hypothetical protein